MFFLIISYNVSVRCLSSISHFVFYKLKELSLCHQPTVGQQMPQARIVKYETQPFKKINLFIDNSCDR